MNFIFCLEGSCRTGSFLYLSEYYKSCLHKAFFLSSSLFGDSL